jgi:hypothetical protein
VRATRTAISPRLAIRTEANMMSGPLRAHLTATVCGSQYTSANDRRVYCGAPGGGGAN